MQLSNTSYTCSMCHKICAQYVGFLFLSYHNSSLIFMCFIHSYSSGFHKGSRMMTPTPVRQSWWKWAKSTSNNSQKITWWRHQMETFSASLTLCAGNSLMTCEFPSQRPVTRSFDVFFDLHWTNCWVSNQDAGDLRRHLVHCGAELSVHILFALTA